MNKRRILLLTALFGGLSLTAQVKIGDNPQTIDPGSLLELESTDKALVITRVTDAQMNAINAQQGAVVYNTDGGCIYYFDGAAWINICESLGLQFTADAIVNSAPTIVITENGDIVNFEVGEIRSENILDFSIGSQDIQDNSINSDKLAPGSVGAEELQDNTVTDRVMDYSVVTLADFTNDAGYLVSGDIISDDDGNDLFPGTDSGVFYDDQFLQDAIDLNTTLLNAKENLSNKSTDINLGTSNTLYPTQNAVKTYVDNTVGGAAQTLTLTGNDLSISGGNSVDLSPFADQNASEVEVAASPDNYNPTDTNVEEHLAAIDVALSTAGAVSGEENGIFFADATPANLGAPVTNVASLFWEQALRFGTGALGVGLENTTHANVGKVQISEQLPTGMAFPLHLNNAVGANGANVGILFGVSGSSPTAKGAIVYERNTAFGTNSGRGSFHILQNQSNASSTRPTLADAVVTVTADALVGIGTTTPSAGNKLQVAGGRTQVEDLYILGELQDAGEQSGSAGQILSSTGTGTQWIDPPSGGGGGTVVTTDGSLIISGSGTAVDPYVIGGDDQTASEVGFSPYEEINSNNTQEAIEQLKDLLDDAVVSGGADGVVSNVTTSGTELAITGANGGFNGNVDLQTLISTAGTNLGYLTAEVDGDTTNEIQTLSIAGNDVSLSNGGGTITIPSGGADGVVSNVTTAGTELAITGANGGFNGNVDLQTLISTAGTNLGYLTTEVDGDTTNEIQTLSIAGNDVSLSNGGGTITIPSGGADGVVSNVTTAGTELAITGANGGFNGNVDLQTLISTAGTNLGYLTAEVDGDTTNEIQTLSIAGNDVSLSNGGGTITIPSGGADGVVSNVTTAGTELAITGANGGFNGNVDLQTLISTAGTNLGYLTAEVDGDTTNEIQTLSIAGNDVSLSNGGGTITIPSAINLSNSNLQQQLSTNRTYDLNSGNLLFTGTGNIRIGPSTGVINNKLHVEGTIRSEGIRNTFGTLPNSVAYSYDNDSDTGMYRAAADQLGLVVGGSEVVRIDNLQNVGIGITSPAAKLHVNGNSQFDGDVLVNGTLTTVPDYVFQSYFTGASELKPDYKMPSLDAVREYVEKNHHLPGVTSAAEVAEQGGIILNEATTQNLEKIEELFLHTIEQEAKIRSLKEENASLATELEDLKARMARIEILLSNQIEE
ncbi:beta strand repeat-containing protein [Robiginitalea biformata]|uniref:beta strand repeat-containing protein n=1 Tax=Robiginitalea biformata TaxID=252307 RepID=UPI003B5B082C